MKRDPRMRRLGERVDPTLGGAHRRPRYHPTPLLYASLVARIGRSLRVPVWLLGGPATSIRAAIAAAAREERRQAIARRLEAGP